MIKVCYQEIKRFKFIILIVISLLSIYAILSGPVNSYSTYVQMNFTIKLSSILSMITVSIVILMDSYNQNQSMYQRISVSVKDVFFGKWLSVIVIGGISLIFGILVMNLRAFIYFNSNELGFLTSGMTSLPLILIDKKWFELLYIPNYFANLMMISFIVLYVNIRIKDIISYGNPYDFKYSIPWMVFKVLLLQVWIRLILIWLEPRFTFLDFNLQGYYKIFGEQNGFLIINFLFIPSIIIFLVYFAFVNYNISELLNKKINLKSKEKSEEA